MQFNSASREEKDKVKEASSPVRAVISWLVEADREFRVAQSMLNERHNKF